jgi:hypothetical protein
MLSNCLNNLRMEVQGHLPLYSVPSFFAFRSKRSVEHRDVVRGVNDRINVKERERTCLIENASSEQGFVG